MYFRKEKMLPIFFLMISKLSRPNKLYGILMWIHLSLNNLAKTKTTFGSVFVQRVRLLNHTSAVVYAFIKFVLISLCHVNNFKNGPVSHRRRCHIWVNFYGGERKLQQIYFLLSQLPQQQKKKINSISMTFQKRGGGGGIKRLLIITKMSNLPLFPLCNLMPR